MTRTREPLEQSSLFDLQLEKDATGSSTVAALELEEDETIEASGASRVAASRPASAVAMLYSACLDFLVHLVVVLIVFVGLRLLGIGFDQRAAPGVLLLVWVFSLFYFVIPLAFWGSSIGMVTTGLIARSDDGQALSLGQATRRWLASCLTTLLAGIPCLFFLSHRSLADRMSGSSTWGRQGS